MTKCWDCGSTIPRHHTQLCELAPKNAIRDLPAIPGTQWWIGSKEEEETKTPKIIKTARIYYDLNGRWVVGYYVGDHFCTHEFATEPDAMAKARELGVVAYYVGNTNKLRRL